MIKNDWNMKHNFLWCLQPLAQQDFHKHCQHVNMSRNLTLPSLRVPEKIWPFVTNSSLLRHHCVPRSKTYTCCGSTAAAMVPGLHLLRKSCSSLRAPLGAVHFMALPRSKTGMLQNLNFDKHCGKKHWHFTGDNPDNPDLQNFLKDNNRLLLWSSSQSRFALWEMRKRKEVPRILPLTLRLFKKTHHVCETVTMSKCNLCSIYALELDCMTPNPWWSCPYLKHLPIWLGDFAWTPGRFRRMFWGTASHWRTTPLTLPRSGGFPRQLDGSPRESRPTRGCQWTPSQQQGPRIRGSNNFTSSTRLKFGGFSKNDWGIPKPWG